MRSTTIYLPCSMPRKSAGVSHFVNIGYEPESWKRTLAIASTHPAISYALGMHPNSAESWSDGNRRKLLSSCWNRSSPVAIGETGLDFFREHADHEAQRRAFRDQLELARHFDLPVVIHMRGEVEAEIIATLEEFPDVRAVFHSFDGSAALRDFLLDRGDSIGVGGLMTRAGSIDLRDVLKNVPFESIVLETDSPYLVPKGRKIPAQHPRVDCDRGRCACGSPGCRCRRGRAGHLGQRPASVRTPYPGRGWRTQVKRERPVVLVATKNAGKLAEFERILGDEFRGRRARRTRS